MIELGGNIELTGFRDNIDGAGMIVLKKIIGNWVRKYSEASSDFEKLSLNLKLVHGSQDKKSSKFQIHAKAVDGGKIHAVEVTNHNLFFAVDSALKKIEKLVK